MIVFSTFLEIDGQPTLYNVYKNKSLAFLNPSRPVKAPIIFATYENASWTIRGTADDRLIKQVVNEIAVGD